MFTSESNHFSSTDQNDDPTTIVAYVVISLSSFIFFKLSTILMKWYFFNKVFFLSVNFFKNKRNSIKSRRYYERIEDNKKWRYVNDCVSLVHSLICVIAVIYYINYYHNENEYFPDMYYNPMGYFFCFIVGYLICDVTELISSEVSIRVFLLILHHLLFGLGCLYPIMVKKCGGLVIIGLVMEGNSLFLHIRSLLKYYKCTKNALAYKMFVMLNLLTFVLFRMLVNLFLCLYCIGNFNNFELKQKIIFISVIFGLLIINVALFYKLLVSDGFIKKNKKHLINDGFDYSSTVSLTSITPSETSTYTDSDSTTTSYNKITPSTDVKTVMISTENYTIPSTNSKYFDTSSKSDVSSILSSETPTTTL